MVAVEVTLVNNSEAPISNICVGEKVSDLAFEHSSSQVFFFDLLRTFTLIVYAHPYCARNSCRNATPRHASSTRAEELSNHI